MAHKGVVTEARLYVTAGSIALLLSAWAALAAGDAVKQPDASGAGTVGGGVVRNQQQVAPVRDTQTKAS